MARARWAALVVIGALLLSGCASGTDPELTKESLEAAASPPPADPTPSQEPEEYNAQLHPEPIVDSLDCTPYLVIRGRGTAEPKKKQLVATASRAIESARPKQVKTVDVDYPADTDVQVGGTRGARWLIDTLNVQAESCPDQRFVLLGYSQGALVIGDALAPPAGRLVGKNAGEVSAAAAERIAAIVFFGNPRFDGSETYNVGTFDPSKNGILPRPVNALDAYAERMRDYCVAGDFICQAGLSLDDAPHLEYYSNGMPADGAAWVITELPPLADTAQKSKDATPSPSPGATKDESKDQAPAGDGTGGESTSDESKTQATPKP